VSNDDGDDDWFESGADEAPFEEGGAAGEGGPGGMPGGPDGGEELFEEDFASAFEGGGSGGGFDEEFESDIPRIDLGIKGLDEMIQGGVPERSLLVVIGSAGTGKTTFGLQFLQQGLQEGECTVYITLEESQDAVIEAATEKGWPFEEYLEDGRLAIVDLDPVEMANSLTSIRGDLPRLVDEFEADRLVLDSVSLLEMMYDDQPDRRTEVFDFTKALKQAGVTTMVTSEADQDNPYASRHGIIEYLTDGVFVLQYVRSEFRETRLAVEIQKIRNANHSRETKPYEITGEGISVYQQANIF
jgi:KaiC domain protein